MKGVLVLLAGLALCSAEMWKLEKDDRIIRAYDSDALASERALQVLRHVDIWGRSKDGGLDMRVSPLQLAALRDLKLNATDITDSVQEHFTWMARNNQICTKSTAECMRAFYDTYQPLDVIHSYLDQLRSNHPTLMQNRSWGSSYEDRNQYGVVVTSPNSPANKPIVFYFCGEHAREWLPVMFCVWMAEQLAAQYGSNNVVTAAMNRFAFYILPVMNPDGYVYSMAGNNMWRKNRQPNVNSRCVGTDLNRNYGFQWNTGGSSSDPCTDIFHGASGWSAPETTNLRYFAGNNTISIMTDVHAYGHMWMYPWGYTNILPPTNAVLLRCAEASTEAIRKVNGQVFAAANIASLVGIASGSSADTFYGMFNVPLSYGAEVRGDSFQPPVSNIGPSNAELWAGMLAQIQCNTAVLDGVSSRT